MTTPFIAKRSDLLDRPRVLSRLADEQPGFVEEPSVSGRSLLRPEPVPDGFRHDVRFWHGAHGLYWECKPCDMRRWLDGGHSLTDLIRLVAMHAGVPDVTLLTTEALLDLLGVAVRP